MKFTNYKCPICSEAFSHSGNTKQHIKNYHPDFLKGKEAMCYQCNTKFPSLSEVRKHQWVAHKEMYEKVIEHSSTANRWGRVKKAKEHLLKGRKRSLKAIAKFKATIAAKKLGVGKELSVRQVLQTTNNDATHFEKPQLSALDLLMKLKEQRDLIISVVNIVEGVINQ